MQNKELVASTIAIENNILLLATHWQQLNQEVADRKDLMRKLREQQIKITHSTYCILSGVPLKKKPQQIYPTLEKETGRLIKARDQLQLQIIAHLKEVTSLLREKKIGAGQLDSQVLHLLSQFQLNFQEQLMGRD